MSCKHWYIRQTPVGWIINRGREYLETVATRAEVWEIVESEYLIDELFNATELEETMDYELELARLNLAFSELAIERSELIESGLPPAEIAEKLADIKRRLGKLQERVRKLGQE